MDPISDKKIIDAIELTLVPGIGCITQNHIWRAFPNISDVFSTGKTTLGALGISNEARAHIRSRGYHARAAEIFDWCLSEGCLFLVRGRPEYPALLEEIPNPPLVLYARGSLDALTAPCIAIVGTRKPTIYGLQMAQGLSSDLGRRGITVVSGLARGIDGASHRGCLQGNGKTIAVLGCGIDMVYPREHQKLAQTIRDNGLLLSEFPPATAPTPHNFPMRNRIISGISLAIVVVEASEYSGSLITARLALEQNREVLAIPGNLTAPQSFGTNYLIKQGAKLIQSWKDVVEEFPSAHRQSISAKEHSEFQRSAQFELLSAEEIRIVETLKIDEATQFDKIYQDSNLGISQLSDLLLNLEVRGFVRQLPGNLYVRINK